MNRHTKGIVIACVIGMAGCDFGSSDDGGRGSGGCVEVAAGDLYVSPDGTGRTSCGKPRVTLQEALSAVGSPGGTIVLAAGTYSGPLELGPGVTLIGAGAGKTIVEAGGEAVIRVSGQGSVALRALTVRGTAKQGILVQDTALVLDGVAVRGLAGDGLHAEGAARLDLRSTVIADNGGRGVYAKGTGPVAIIDPVYAKDPRQTAKVGIIDPVYAPASRITGNKQGGVAIIDPVYSPKSDAPGKPANLLRATRIEANGRYGLGLWSAGILVQKTAIVGTAAGQEGPWADGLLVAKGSTTPTGILVQIGAGSLVAGNARTGVLVTTDADLEVGGDVSGNGLGGVWGQGGKTSILVQDTAALHANKAVGVVASGGARLAMTGARVTGTLKAAVGKGVEMGDGVGIFSGSSAVIRQSKLIDNARAAILVQDAAKNSAGEADVVVEGCEMKGGEYTFVINGAPVPGAALSTGNDASGAHSGGGSPGDGYESEADLAAQTDYCAAFSDGCAATP